MDDWCVTVYEKLKPKYHLKSDFDNDIVLILLFFNKENEPTMQVLLWITSIGITHCIQLFKHWTCTFPQL